MRFAGAWLRRGLLGLVALFGVLLLVLLGTFGYLQIESRKAVTLPAPTGPYPVGRTIYDWTDHTRLDPFSPRGQSARELSVWAWYPARVPRGAQRASYLPPAWQQAFQGSDFLHTRADAVTTHAWANVPVVNGGPALPVLAFMPGFGRVAADYTTLAEELASQGYVVFAVNPTYLSDAVVLGAGRVIKANRQLAAKVDSESARGPIAGEVTEVEAADLRFAVDQAQELNRTAGGRFAQRLDTSRIGFLGHSIGGSSATRGCELDSRCAGAVNLDGAVFGPVVTEGIHKPYLFLGEDPSISPPPKAELRGVVRGMPAGEDQMLSMRGAGHMNFADMGVMYKFPPNQLGLIGPIDGARALTIVRAYLRAFFGSHLRGTPSPLLSDQASPFPEISVVTGVA